MTSKVQQLSLFGETPLDMVNEYQTTSEQEPDSMLYRELIHEEMYELTTARPDTTDELKELADLVYVIYGYANTKNWDLDEAVKRVHENNMGRMYQPDGTIKRRDDGKIVKNKDFPKVDLKDLV